MGNTTITEVTQHKHLGLVFSNDATWTNHITGIAAKARKNGCLRRNKFILDRSSLERMYISFIRPFLEYANIFWDNCTIENRRIVKTIQLEAARIVKGGTKLFSSIQRLYSSRKHAYIILTPSNPTFM